MPAYTSRWRVSTSPSLYSTSSAFGPSSTVVSGQGPAPTPTAEPVPSVSTTAGSPSAMSNGGGWPASAYVSVRRSAATTPYATVTSCSATACDAT
jgi:hypothetical protein